MSRQRQDQNKTASQSESQELEELFRHLPQAILSYDSDLKVNAFASPSVERLFGLKKPAKDLDVCDLIFGDDSDEQPAKRRFRYEMALAFDNSSLQWEVGSDHLPRKVHRSIHGTEKIIRIQYVPFFNADKNLTRVMLAMDDVTAYESWREKATEQEQKLEIISDLLKVHDSVFDAFMDETERVFENCHRALAMMKTGTREPVAEGFDILMRQIHTLKGCAGLFNLSSIQNAAHEVEERLVKLRAGADPETISLLEVDHLVASIESEVGRYLSLRKELLNREFDSSTQAVPSGHLLWFLSLTQRMLQALRNPSLSIRDVDALFFEAQRAAERIGKVHLHQYLQRYDQMIHRNASLAGKKIKPLTVQGENLFFDLKTLSRISDIVTHCVNNAIDHGIETPEAREQAGKNRSGVITIVCERDQGVLSFAIVDDGKGIDPNEIARHCVEKGLLTAKQAQKLSDEQLLQMIFEPGFSTAATISASSGRGFGMNAIREVVRELGGQVGVLSNPGRGTSIVVQIPDPERQALPNFALFDLVEELRSSMPSSREFHNHVLIDPDARMQVFPILGDRVAVHQLLHHLHFLIYDYRHRTGQVTIQVQTLTGKRKVDSDHFYRITVAPKNFKLSPAVLSTHQFTRLHDLLPRVFGSLQINKKGQMEINIPSGMPQGFQNLHVDVLLLTRDTTLTRRFAENYFENQLQFVTCKFSTSLEPFENATGHRIVIVDDQNQDRYREYLVHAAADQMTQVVFVTNEPQSIHAEINKNAAQEPLVVIAPFTRQLAFQVLELTVVRWLVEARLYQAQTTTKKSQTTVNS